MSLTVLKIVQNFADEQGIPSPSALIGATDKSTKQLVQLLRSTIAQLAEYKWPERTVRRTFVSVAGQVQGPMTTLFLGDYAGMVQDSMWNDTRHMRVFGPLSEQIWNALQTLPNAGPEYQMWVSRGILNVSPAFVSGETISAIVYTTFSVLAVDGTTYKEYVTADNDSVIYPDNVMITMLKAKWRKQKGESGWEDDWNDALGMVNRAIIKAGSTVLSLDVAPNRGPRPGIVIPPGSWNVS